MSESQLVAVCGLAGASLSLVIIHSGLNAAVDVVLRRRERTSKLSPVLPLTDSRRRAR